MKQPFGICFFFYQYLKSTLHLAIDYIVNGDKTDEQLLVSAHKCHQTTAHTQFLRTRVEAGTKGTVLIFFTMRNNA